VEFCSDSCGNSEVSARTASNVGEAYGYAPFDGEMLKSDTRLKYPIAGVIIAFGPDDVFWGNDAGCSSWEMARA
jgi:hypothetical protein